MSALDYVRLGLSVLTVVLNLVIVILLVKSLRR